MMPFMGVFWFVALVLLVVTVVVAFRWREGTQESDETRERHSAGLAILDERYARGEINHDQYHQKKQEILGHG